jgi:dTDP-4-amino-4,6-dideoxygalactose transaminase
MYNEMLSPLGIKLPKVLFSDNHSFQSYVILLPEHKSRNKLIELMKEDGIETTLGTYAMHSQPFFREYSSLLSLEKSKFAQDNSLSLPLHLGMRKRHVKRVVFALEKNLSKI